MSNTFKNTENITVGGIEFDENALAILRDGGSLSGVVGEGPTVIPATRSVDISTPAGHNLRPAIRGNETHDNKGERISRPSPRLAKRLDNTKALQQQQKEDRKRQEELSVLEPEALRRDIEFLRRTVKRLEKTVAELKSNDS